MIGLSGLEVTEKYFLQNYNEYQYDPDYKIEVIDS